MLWIKGHPGTGKSTIMKHTLRYCEKQFRETHVIAAHFFNARGESFERTPLGMLRSLLYQLLDQETSIYERFIPLFRDKSKKQRSNLEWRESELKDFLLLEMQYSQSKPLLILVDALDECSRENVRDVVKFLEKLSLNAKRTLNICLSSRHYPNISIEKHLKLVVEKEREHEKDIIKYVRAELTFRNEEIENMILEKASGVFMWVVLVINLLMQAHDKGRIDAMHQKLQDVPSDLEDVFETLVKKDNQEMEETIFILQCVLFAKRPLSPEELFSVMIAELSATNTELGNQLDITPNVIRQRILDSSRGLVEFRKGTPETVQFIHESVNDFLIRNQRLKSLDPALEADPIGGSHERLKSCCFSYITEEVSESPKIREQVKVLESNYPFLRYASTYVLFHAEEAYRNGIAQTKFLQHLEEEHDTLERMRLFHNSFEVQAGSGCARGVTLLHMLAVHGYSRLAEALLDNDINIDIQGGLHGTALQAAAAVCDEKMVKMLLNKGAKINAQGGIYGNALQAAVRGNENIVKMLLNGGAKINAQGGIFGNALQAATAPSVHYDRYDDDDYDYDKEKIIKMLLKGGANVNAQGGVFGNALQAAAIMNYEKAVKILLKEGAHVNAQGGMYCNALQAAATSKHRNRRIVEMLVKEGANVNAQGGIYGNALQAARSMPRGNGIIRVLCENGADANILESYPNTELKIALFKSEKYTDTQGKYFSTALWTVDTPRAQREVLGHFLTDKSRFDILTRNMSPETLLFGERTDANSQWGLDTVLWLTVTCTYNVEYAARMVEKGANVNAQILEFPSALAMAMLDEKEELIAMLLENGADIKAQHNTERETRIRISTSGIYSCLVGLVLIFFSYFMWQFC